jgi:hypothetical protein
MQGLRRKCKVKSAMRETQSIVENDAEIKVSHRTGP